MITYTHAGAPLLAESSQDGRSSARSLLRRPRRRHCWLVGVCVLLGAAMALYLYVVRAVPQFAQYHIVRSYPSAMPRTGQSNTRTVLLWNSFFGDRRWDLPADIVDERHLRDTLHCPVYQCEVTHRRDFLPAIDMYDAVLFHTAEAFPLLQPLPLLRHAHQLYVFALMEPPSETKHVLGDETHLYNLTMSYRLDSDVLWNYKSVLDVESGAVVAPALRPAWRRPPATWLDSRVQQLWPNKTRNIGWFVSHCATLSRREELVAALQRHIDVDTYGKCGTHSCQHTQQEQCDMLLDTQYKFYLSFENALCSDYVTEKLYNAMQRQLIPVVFGGADYTRFVPPHSYIDAEHFATVEALASYLTYLSTHPEQYMRYFWWRRYYTLIDHSPFCQLCEILHSPAHRHKTQSYANIEQWWLGGSCRFKSKIKF